MNPPNNDSGYLTLRKYDIPTLSIDSSAEMASDVSSIKVGNKFVRLSDTIAIIEIDDTYHGNELYKLNLNSLGLALINDLYKGPIGSDPIYYTQSGDDIYFTANAADYSRQLFKYNIVDDTIMLSNKLPDNKLLTFPNPGHDVIAFDEELLSYIIYERNGNVVMENNSGNLLQVNIKDLSPGSYFLSGVNLEGEKVSAQFLKM